MIWVIRARVTRPRSVKADGEGHKPGDPGNASPFVIRLLAIGGQHFIVHVTRSAHSKIERVGDLIAAAHAGTPSSTARNRMETCRAAPS
jgi:hypothetical protein